MLPKHSRLNSRREFSELRKTGRMINSESFGFLYCAPSVAPPAGGAKWGKFFFIVSTKISKKATERNLIKRRLRAIVRELTADNLSGVCPATCPSKPEGRSGKPRAGEEVGSGVYPATCPSKPEGRSGAFLCKKKILGKTYAELKKEVENVIAKIKN